MSKKLRVRDKKVLTIVDKYVVDRYGWREYWEQLADVLVKLRGGSREQSNAG
jgi:hypothetical protein